MNCRRIVSDLIFGLVATSVGLFGCGTSNSIAQHDFKNNSMRKIRVEPGPQAARIGSAVKWQPDLEAALAESKSTGKPIFWYVPTLRGSFMDRTDSIDRYMLAGPFSWPDIITVLNENFVPVKATPKQKQQEKFELQPYVFIEPGFVILDSKGELVRKVDRLTTLHPQWFRALLTGFVDQPSPLADKSRELTQLWKQFSAGDYANMKFSLAESSTSRTEELLLAGMVDFRLGKHETAKAKWQSAATTEPDSPLAWKAAAEAEGFGPFVRGFEVHDDLPAGALSAGRTSAGSAAPAGVYDAPALWQRGVEFLLGMQNENGAWTDCDYDFGGTDSLPNVHVAVTSIAGMALLEYQSQLPADSPLAEQVESAITRAADFVANDGNLNLSDRDELLWAYAYRIRFLSRMTQRDPKYLASLQGAVKLLAALQNESGGWFHEYENPFVTASALLAFFEAATVGAPTSTESLERGLQSLRHDRFDNGAFPYSSVPRGRDLPTGTDGHVAQSAGRMPLCELALWTGKKSDDQALANAVQQSLDLNIHLMRALKYDDHTSNMAYGGFFFWYDLQSRSEAISKISEKNLKAKFYQAQRELVLSLPEIDGCFVDSHELGRVYGTAMALLSLTE